MPFQFKQACAAANPGISNPTATFSSNVSKGDLIVVMALCVGNGTSVTSMSLADTQNNVTSWTPIWGSFQEPSGGTLNKYIQGWYGFATTTGPCAPQNTTNQNIFGNCLLFAAEFSGVAKNASIDSSNYPTSAAAASGANDTFSPLTFSITTSEIIFLAAFSNNANQSDAPSNLLPFTFAAQSAGGYSAFSCYAIATSGTYDFAATYTATGTGNSAISCGFALKVTASTSGGFLLLGVG